jgi:hypothetical protein
MDLFGKKKIALLEAELKAVKAMLYECGEKLTEKQEHINKTNAYWKKKVREVHNSSKQKK